MWGKGQGMTRVPISHEGDEMQDGGIRTFFKSVRTLMIRRYVIVRSRLLVMRQASREDVGQGTTEYAILVGVLVVIAIVAVTAFRGKLQTLWDSIASGVNGL